jgi:hypothetical protein
MAALGLMIAIVAVALEQTHLQLVSSWTAGIPFPSRPSPFASSECLWTHACMYIGEDPLLSPILAISVATLVACIAIKRRYRRMKYGET